MQINDGLASLSHSIGRANRDKLSSTFFTGNTGYIDELVSAYESNWMAKNLVDIPAEWAVRNWRSWNGSTRSVNKIKKIEKDLMIKSKVLDALKKARLYGESFIYIGMGGDLHKKPRNKKVEFLTVLTPNEISVAEYEKDPSKMNFRQPSKYRLSNGYQTIVDESRVVYFKNSSSVNDKPVSILQQSYHSLLHSSTSEHNVASLLFETNVDVFRIPDLGEKLSTPEKEQAVHHRLQIANSIKGNLGSLILDAEEDYKRHTISFGGMKDLLNHFVTLVGASQRIPASIFLSQSPAGLNSTGEAEIENFCSEIKSIQSLFISNSIKKLDDLITSGLNVEYEWSECRNKTEKEIQETGQKIAEIADKLVKTGLFQDSELRVVIANQLTNSGVFPELNSTIEELNNEFDNDEEIDYN